MAGHVLIVDDNGDDRWSLSQVVNRLLHHAVTEAVDGVEAIRLAHDGAYDLILIDMNMPRLQGPEVVKTLRAMTEYSKTPIIAVTAYDLPEARSASLQSGCNNYLTKPINVDELVDLISGYLGQAA
jgi:CheY-like chemotaxis protein